MANKTFNFLKLDEWVYNSNNIERNANNAMRLILPTDTSKPTIKSYFSFVDLGMVRLTGFSITQDGTPDGSIGVLVSKDSGANWEYWNGSEWTIATPDGETVNSVATVNANIEKYIITGRRIDFLFFFISDGTQQPNLLTFSFSYYQVSVLNCDSALPFDYNQINEVINDDEPNNTTPIIIDQDNNLIIDNNGNIDKLTIIKNIDNTITLPTAGSLNDDGALNYKKKSGFSGRFSQIYFFEFTKDVDFNTKIDIFDTRINSSTDVLTIYKTEAIPELTIAIRSNLAFYTQTLTYLEAEHFGIHKLVITYDFDTDEIFLNLDNKYLLNFIIFQGLYRVFSQNVINFTNYINRSNRDTKLYGHYIVDGILTTEQIDNINLQLDSNLNNYVIENILTRSNLNPLVSAGIDKTGKIGVAKKYFSDANFFDYDGEVVKAEYSLNGGARIEIPKGGFSTLLEAIREFDLILQFDGDNLQTLELIVTDDSDDESSDTINITIENILLTLNLVTVDGDKIIDWKYAISGETDYIEVSDTAIIEFDYSTEEKKIIIEKAGFETSFYLYTPTTDKSETLVMTTGKVSASAEKKIIFDKREVRIIAE